MQRPQRTRVYDDHSLNSQAWDNYRPRPGDVIISTALKAGTTWMQNIVGGLIFQDEPMPGLVWELSLWPDSSFGAAAEKLAQLEAQTHRRFLKTHLPLDALPYFPEVDYIYVARDGRDVFMSLWNHYRHLPNILFVHFNDLLADLDGQMRRIAAYLDVVVHEETWPALVEKLTFKAMKARAAEVVPGGGGFLQGGAARFLNKGTNGRWRGILTAAELGHYDAVVKKQLSPECRRWLEVGDTAVASP